MKALVFHAPGKVSVDTVLDPTIQKPDDVILRVTSTAICGSDLHIYNGFFPQTRPMTLGHEFMGIVEETGSGVTQLQRGDRVIVPFPIACGACFFCQHDLPCHCEHSNPEKYGPRAELKGSGVTVTCLMPGATETDFFERADMLDTKVGTQKKDDPADVAKTGFDAMMRGDGDVVSGWQNKLQSRHREHHARRRARRATPQNGRARVGDEKRLRMRRALAQTMNASRCDTF